MRRSKSQAVYKILPGMWVADKDRYGKSATALVKTWNYKKMDGIYSSFIEAEIKRQIRLFALRGGDISSFNVDESKESFLIVEAACRPGIPDITAELSPLVYYCPECHRATQFRKPADVTRDCPICKQGKIKQLQLVYPCECGYASPILIPKINGIKEFYYHPTEKRYGMFYFQGKNRNFKEFGMKCPNCGQYIQRDSAEAGSNYKAFNTNVINLIGPDMGKFYEKGEAARKLIVSKWFNCISQDGFENIVKNADTAFSEKTTNSAIREEAEKQAKALLSMGLIKEDQLEQTISSLAQSSNDNELNIESYVSACDNIFMKEKNESEENYRAWINNFAFSLMQYETIKNANVVITLDESIDQQLDIGFIDHKSEIEKLNSKLGISNVQASGNVEIVSCSYGFTRKVTDPHSAKGNLKLVAFDRDADTDRHLAYGTKLETEGILFDIDRVKILKWLLCNNIIAENQMPDIEDETAVKKWFAQNVHSENISTFGGIDDNDPITKNVFLLLHSMSHAFINTAGEMSGISANSLTEIIFVETCSIFVYSQSGQGQILGSLSGMFESLFGRYLKRVYSDNRECVFDPICVDRDGSSCQGCLVLADTSCKYFNTQLGRKYLYTLKTEKNNLIGFWEM